MTLPLTNFEFRCLKVHICDNLKDMPGTNQYIAWYKSVLKLVNHIHAEVTTYDKFQSFCYKSYADKVKTSKKKVEGYNIKGELLWTITWTGPTKSS